MFHHNWHLLPKYPHPVYLEIYLAHSQVDIQERLRCERRMVQLEKDLWRHLRIGAAAAYLLREGSSIIGGHATSVRIRDMKHSELGFHKRFWKVQRSRFNAFVARVS